MILMGGYNERNKIFKLQNKVVLVMVHHVDKYLSILIF
jgi:hypothetical protein